MESAACLFDGKRRAPGPFCYPGGVRRATRHEGRPGCRTRWKYLTRFLPRRRLQKGLRPSLNKELLMATTTFASSGEVCRLIAVLVLGLVAASGACSTLAPAGSVGTSTLPSVADGGVVADVGVFPPNVSVNPRIFDPTASAADPPPAISGGTLAILSDGVTAVAADPDRDTIAVANLTTQTVTAKIALQP